jgi:hypothetical protein
MLTLYLISFIYNNILKKYIQSIILINETKSLNNILASVSHEQRA